MNEPYFKDLFTLRVREVEGYSYVIVSDEVKGLFINDKNLEKALGKVPRALKLLVKDGAKVKGINI